MFTLDHYSSGKRVWDFDGHSFHDSEQQGERMNPIQGKMEAGVVKVDGISVGQSAYLSIDGVSIAEVFAGPVFGNEEDVREIALANAKRLAELWNGQSEAGERDALLKAAMDVVWFDWSDNDADAVAAIEQLRSAISHEESKDA